MDYMNLVYARHPGCDKPFIFRLPLGYKATSGEYLSVHTNRGQAIAITAASSFIVPAETAEVIVTLSGGYYPPAPVTGKLVTETHEVPLIIGEADELPF